MSITISHRYDSSALIIFTEFRVFADILPCCPFETDVWFMPCNSFALCTVASMYRVCNHYPNNINGTFQWFILCLSMSEMYIDCGAQHTSIEQGTLSFHQLTLQVWLIHCFWLMYKWLQILCKYPSPGRKWHLYPCHHSFNFVHSLAMIDTTSLLNFFSWWVPT